MPGGHFHFRKKKFHTDGTGAVLRSNLGYPYWNRVALALRGTAPIATGTFGQNNSIIDSSALKKTITRFGNVAQGTFSPFPTLGGSAYFDGTGDYLTIGGTDFAFGTSNLTIEFWVNLSTLTGFRTILDFRAATGDLSYNIYANTGTGTLFVDIGTGNRLTATTSLVVGAWAHIAYCRVGTIGTLYVNGVASGTATHSSTLIGTSVTVGSTRSSVANLLTGFIANLNIINGTAKYTANFAVPTTPALEDPNTKLLLNFNNLAITDVSNRNNIETVGSAQFQTDVSKFGKGSYRFNGTTDYLMLSASNNYAFGTGDFTIECYVNLIAVSTTQQFIVCSWVSPYPFGLDIASNAIRFNINGGVVINFATTIAINTWYHLAVTRCGSVLQLFLNGVSVARVSNTTNISGGQKVSVGAKTDDLANKLNGHIEDLLITSGVAVYTGSFTPRTSTFPTSYAETSVSTLFANDVVFHMDMEGTEGSQVFTTRQGHSCSNGINTGITSASDFNTKLTAANKKFGGTSLFLDGAFDNVSYSALGSEFALNANPFTVELWINFVNNGTKNDAGVFQGLIMSNGAWMLHSNGNSVTAGTGLIFNGGGRSSTCDFLFAKNTWYHIALCRATSFGKVNIFINGVMQTLTTDTFADYNFGTTSSGGRIGSWLNGSGGNYQSIGAYIDELIVTRAGKYASNFTPATQAFEYALSQATDPYLKTSVVLKSASAVSSTGMAVYNNNTILDSSSNNSAVTRFGNVAQGTFSPFSAMTTAFNPTGTFGALTTPASAQFGFNGGVARTFESWAYVSDNQTLQAVLESSPGGTGSFVIYFSAGALKAGASNSTQTTQAIPVGQWFHWAVTISGTTVTPFVNGIKGTSVTATISVANTSFTIGSRAGLYTVTGNLAYFMVYNGTRYTSNFTPATTLVSDVYTILLLPLVKDFKDVSGNNSGNPWIMTIGGSPSLVPFTYLPSLVYSTATHGGSAYFDGTGDYLSIPDSPNFSFGTSDFTIEFRIFPEDVTSVKGVMTKGTGNTTSSFLLQIETGTIKAYFSSGSGWLQNGGSLSGTLVKNQYSHIAVTRQDTTFRMFVNGVLASSNTHAQALVDSSTPLLIGQEGTGFHTKGYLSDINIESGAKYTANFTPSSLPIVASANTKLLLNFTNSAIVDATGKLNLETVSTIRTDVANKRLVSSIRLNGSSDYLAVANNPMFNFGTGDFTIECWVNLFSTATTGGGSPTLIGGSNSANNWVVGISDTGVSMLMSTTSLLSVSGAATSLGSWNHYAISRVNGVLNGFRNGLLLGSVANTTSISMANPLVYIFSQNGAVGMINGLAEDFRITKGVGRYVTNFMVPLKEFPTV